MRRRIGRYFATHYRCFGGIETYRHPWVRHCFSRVGERHFARITGPALLPIWQLTLSFQNRDRKGAVGRNQASRPEFWFAVPNARLAEAAPRGHRLPRSRFSERSPPPERSKRDIIEMVDQAVG